MKRIRICCVCNDVFYLDRNIPFTYNVKCSICKIIPLSIQKYNKKLIFILNYIFNR